MEIPASAAPFPPLIAISRLGLALGMGLFVGLEREWRHKEAGLRTFGFTAMLCAIGGMLGQAYALVSIGIIGILIVFLNWQSIRAGEKAELTTSVALAVTGLVGVLAGLGQTFTPVAAALVTAWLLAWKEQLAGFSLGLTVVELRSAILLAILAFIVYPILPRGALDPWGLVEPRAAWVTVILIAAIGFGNYILLKMFGSRGVQLAGFLGGLVNSTVTAAELGGRARESSLLVDVTYRGVLLATCAMALRNAFLLGILAMPAFLASLLPLVLILVGSLGFALARDRRPAHAPAVVPTIAHTSPFSLQSALKFGLLFLVLEVVGSLGQNLFGHGGFYAVSVIGGVVSSASAVASAAMLAAQGKVTPTVAGIGAVLASLASAAVNFVLAVRVASEPRLSRRLAGAIGAVILLGVVGAVLQTRMPPSLTGHVESMLGARFGHLAH